MSKIKLWNCYCQADENPQAAEFMEVFDNAVLDIIATGDNSMSDVTSKIREKGFQLPGAGDFWSILEARGFTLVRKGRTQTVAI